MCISRQRATDQGLALGLSSLPTILPSYIPTISWRQALGQVELFLWQALQDQHETVRSQNTSLQLEHLFFSWPTQCSTKEVTPELRPLHTHQPLTSQSGGSKVDPAKGDAGMGPVHLSP